MSAPLCRYCGHLVSQHVYGECTAHGCWCDESWEMYQELEKADQLEREHYASRPMHEAEGWE